MGILLRPFSWLLLFFYRFAGYGIALILFALVIKLILFPVTLKSKKSMIQMNMLSGKMQQLQKQYGKDRDRYNQEVKGKSQSHGGLPLVPDPPVFADCPAVHHPGAADQLYGADCRSDRTAG